MGIPMRGAKLSESVPRMEPHEPAREAAPIPFYINVVPQVYI